MQSVVIPSTAECEESGRWVAVAPPRFLAVYAARNDRTLCFVHRSVTPECGRKSSCQRRAMCDPPLRPATCDLRPATCDLRPATPPATHPTTPPPPHPRPISRAETSSPCRRRHQTHPDLRELGTLLRRQQAIDLDVRLFDLLMDRRTERGQTATMRFCRRFTMATTWARCSAEK